MTIVEQEVDAVFLRLDRIVDRTCPDDLEVGRANLITAGRPRLRFYFTGYRDRGLRRELAERSPHFRRDLRLHEHCLEDAGAVADHGERDLSRRSYVRHPPANGRGLSDVVVQLRNAKRRLSHPVTQKRAKVWSGILLEAGWL